MHLDILPGEPVANVKPRYVQINGRQFIVAPITMLRSRVLRGSKGALFYPRDEIAKTVEQWNGKPLVVKHPVRDGSNISANNPDVFEKQTIGWVYESKLDSNGDNECAGYFDVELTKKHDIRIYNNLVEGKKIEVSTGLYTDNEEAPKGSAHEGVEYNYIARNYKPDHLAILPDDVGACSVKDGCGVFNESVEEEKTDEKLIYPSSCPQCRTPLEIDPDSGRCNRCGADFLPESQQTSNNESAMNERANIINWLTTNCACLKDRKATLNALSDSALKEVLLEQVNNATEKGEDVDNDQSFLDWIGNADKDIKNAFVSMIRKKIRGAVGSNEFPVKKGPPKPGADEAVNPEDEMMKKKKMEEEAAATANAAITNHPLIKQLSELIPALNGVVANHNATENAKKQHIANALTANITNGNERVKKVTELIKLPLNQLELMASLMPVGNAALPFSQEYNHNPVANYFGASGGPTEIVDNSELQKEKLEIPTINWAEWAKDTSVYDSQKA